MPSTHVPGCQDEPTHTVPYRRAAGVTRVPGLAARLIYSEAPGPTPGTAGGGTGGSMGTGKLWVAALGMVVALAGTARAQTVEIEYWQYTFPQRVQAIDELVNRFA